MMFLYKFSMQSYKLIRMQIRIIPYKNRVKHHFKAPSGKICDHRVRFYTLSAKNPVTTAFLSDLLATFA